MAAHAGGKTHTSLLQIKDYKCEKSKGTISGSVKTGNDLGGADYKLSFSGAVAEIQVFCDVLEVLKKTGGFAALEISDLKEQANSTTTTGKLNAISIEKPSD